MRVQCVSTGLTALAVAGVSAMTISSANPVPEVYQSPAAHHQIDLAAAVTPAPGALLERALLNQVQNFQLQLPFIGLGAIEGNAAAARLPLTFVQALLSGAGPLQSVGIAGYSVTSIVSEAWTGLVLTDGFQIVPRTQNSLGWAVLSGIRIAEAIPSGNFLEAIQTGRTDLFDALSQPLFDPVFDANGNPQANPDANTLPPTEDLTLPEVVGVETVNVLSVTVLQSTSVALLGIIDAPNQFYKTLAVTGDPVKAVLASGGRFVLGFKQAGDYIGTAVDTAVENIEAAAHRTEAINDVASIPSGAGGAFKTQSNPTIVNTPDQDPVTPSDDDDTPFKKTARPSGPKAPTGERPLVRPSFKAVVGSVNPGATPGGSSNPLDFQPGKHAREALGNLGATVKEIADKVTKGLGGPAAKPEPAPDPES